MLCQRQNEMVGCCCRWRKNKPLEPSFDILCRNYTCSNGPMPRVARLLVNKMKNSPWWIQTLNILLNFVWNSLLCPENKHHRSSPAKGKERKITINEHFQQTNLPSDNPSSVIPLNSKYIKCLWHIGTSRSQKVVVCSHHPLSSEDDYRSHQVHDSFWAEGLAQVRLWKFSTTNWSLLPSLHISDVFHLWYSLSYSCKKAWKDIEGLRNVQCKCGEEYSFHRFRRYPR